MRQKLVEEANKMATYYPWEYLGLSTKPDFNDNLITDADTGEKIAEKMQMRLVHTFKRRRLEVVHTSLTLGEGQAGEYTTGIDLVASTAGKPILPPVTIGNNAPLWVCTDDNVEQDDPYSSGFYRVQVWERRDPYEDYEWPTTGGA